MTATKGHTDSVFAMQRLANCPVVVWAGIKSLCVIKLTVKFT